MGNTSSIKSETWFDRLPTEILFEIFGYLSNNEIIYTFLNFNERLNYLLLHNQRYLNAVYLPTSNFNQWEEIFLVIGSEIERLTINTSDFSFPLKYFSNLKSIIISTPYGLPEELFRLLFTHEYFLKLHSFEIKEKKLLSDQSNKHYAHDQNIVLERVFNTQNSLQTFQCLTPLSLQSLSDQISYKINYNLRSLKIILVAFRDIFLLLSYTPNLEYLNLHAELSPDHSVFIHNIDVKLKQLHLTLNTKPYPTMPRYFNQLVPALKQFSSSLICLSLHFIQMHFNMVDIFLYDSVQLQEFLHPLKTLKEFHLYTKVQTINTNPEEIFSRFNDYNWSFGMYGNYFFTLPFYFDYLHEFPNNFNAIKSNNPDILITNPRIWFNVESIQLIKSQKSDWNFLNQLKTKMPRLTFIKFLKDDSNKQQTITNNHDGLDIKLNTVTTIEYSNVDDRYEHQWFLSRLPNLKNLIIFNKSLPWVDWQHIPSFYQKIQRIGTKNYYPVEQLIDMNYIYFSHVEHIYASVYYLASSTNQSYADVILKILNNYRNLQSLVIYEYQAYEGHVFNHENELKIFAETLNIEKITKNYQIKCFRRWIIISKHHSNNQNIQRGFLRKKLSFFKRKKMIP